MKPFDIIGNTTKPFFKLMLNTIKEMFYLIKFLEINRLSTCNLGIYLQDLQLCSEFIYGILYKCSFTEPLTLLRDVIFDKVNVMKIFFLKIYRLSTCNFGIYLQDWQLCSEFTAESLGNVALGNP